ncbi:MAG: PEGA domain-containing protein, partial [Planctomycetota bacterium]|nr:PEGA domain-containing protein [Planctomycetota bacterium]
MNRLPIVALFLLPLLGGCVLREFLIQSEPAGAEVFLDGRYIGKTPLKQSFDFYGTHRVVLRKNGYIA